VCAPTLWTPDRTIEAARRWYAKHGRSPRRGEWPDTGCPSGSTVGRLFPDGWDAMLAAAGLPAPPRCEPRWTRARIEAAIQRWTGEHGRPPLASDWARATPDTPHRVTVLVACGPSFAGAVERALLTAR
jgi:hypothetical protein